MTPERLFVLRSDAELLSELGGDQAESVIAGTTPLRNVHGELMTVEYVRADIADWDDHE